MLGFHCTQTSCVSESYEGIGLVIHTPISPGNYKQGGHLDEMYIFSKYAWAVSLTCPYSFTLFDGLAVLFGVLSFASFLLMVKWCRTHGKSYVIPLAV